MNNWLSTISENSIPDLREKELEIAQLKSGIRERNLVNSQLQQKNTQQVQTITQLRNEIGQLKSEIYRLRDTVNQLQRNLAGQEQAVVNVRARLASFQSTFNEMTMKMEERIKVLLLKLMEQNRVKGQPENVSLSEQSGLHTETLPVNQEPQQKTKPAAPKDIGDTKLLELIPHPKITVVLGKRGSGKTALAFRLLELLRAKLALWVFRFPGDKNFLPDWIGRIDRIEDFANLPKDSVVLVDETSLYFNARRSQQKANLAINDVIGVSRHNDLSLIFIAQTSAQIDRNILNNADVIILKEMNVHQLKFDRRELKEIFSDAARKFSALSPEARVKNAFVYAPDCEFADLLEINLPSFWLDGLSKAYGQSVTPVGNNAPSFPRTMTIAEKISQAKKMHKAGYHLSRIAESLEISKTTAHRYVKSPVVQ